MKCELLGPSWVTRAIDLRMSNPSDVEGPPLVNSMWAQHVLDNQYMVDGNSFYRAYGVVDGDRLWCYGLQKLLVNQRAWVLKLVVSNQRENNGLKLNGLGLVLDAMLEYAESLRYYHYYTATPAERAAAHDRVWSSVSEKKGQRYTSCVEEVLPPRTMSAFSIYWDDVLGSVMFDVPCAIRHVFLKPEHRQWSLE